MSLVDVREFVSVAEMMAHYKKLRMRKEALWTKPKRSASSAGSAGSGSIGSIAGVNPLPAESRAEPLPSGGPIQDSGSGAVSATNTKTLSEQNLFESTNCYQIVKTIISAVARELNVEPFDIISSRRTRNILVPRHIAITLSTALTNRSLPWIGRMFNRDHTSILHAYRRWALTYRMIIEEMPPSATLAQLIRVMQHYAQDVYRQPIVRHGKTLR